MENTFAKLRIGVLLFVATFFVLLLGKAESFRDIPDDNLAYPVLLASKENSGSGFFYNKDDASYLITARHVLFKETSVSVPKQFAIPGPLRHKVYWPHGKEKMAFLLTFSGVMSESDRDELIKAAPKSDPYKKAIEQLHRESQKLKLRGTKTTLFSYSPKVSGGIGMNELEVQLTKLFESGQIKYHPSCDVALIRIGTPGELEGQVQVKFVEGITKKQGVGFVGLGKDNPKFFEDVLVGNTVFAFGYPTTITGISPWLDVKLPLLRKGVIAGKNALLKAIILDCPMFGGNSGGLVIEAERTSISETKYKAIGLVTNFVPYQLEWFQNSGYSIVVPMDFVEELIKGQTK